jgi:hypothetical protein
MQNTEEYVSWLESRRLIISQLTALEVSIRDLDIRIDRYNEVSREKTLEIANRAEAGITDLKIRVDARELLAQLWSGAIGLVSGGVAAAVIELLTHRFGQ